jgi:isoamylase
LASIMNRDRFGNPVDNAPLIEELTLDPLLSNVKLIAEPWDAAGLYQVGGFAPKERRWGEWNGKFRDSVRSFIKGDPHSKNEFANRLCGSQDIYSHRSPQASINFVAAHDGFSIRDLVSYNQKHNLENGESNRDGNNYNVSWNCGIEGPTEDKNIEALRLRQMKNFFTALFFSQGVPMFLMGDEYGHTRRGNNNPWCQDNELNWFLWEKSNPELHSYVQRLIQFRKKEPLLKKEIFLTDKDITWHGVIPLQPNWHDEKPFLAFTLGDKIYAAFNCTKETLQVKLPALLPGQKWGLLFHSFEGELKGDELAMPSFSSAVLLK